MVTYQLLLGALGLLCGIGVAAGVFALVASLGIDVYKRQELYSGCRCKQKYKWSEESFSEC